MAIKVMYGITFAPNNVLLLECALDLLEKSGLSGIKEKGCVGSIRKRIELGQNPWLGVSLFKDRFGCPGPSYEVSWNPTKFNDPERLQIDAATDGLGSLLKMISVFFGESKVKRIPTNPCRTIPLPLPR